MLKLSGVSFQGIRRMQAVINKKSSLSYEESDNLAEDVLASVGNPASFTYLGDNHDFPGMDKLGFPDEEVGTAISLALQSFRGDGDPRDTVFFGRLSCMLQYGIVSKEAIKDGL